MITKRSIYSFSLPRWKNKMLLGVVDTEYYTSQTKLPQKYRGASLKKFGNVLSYVDKLGNRIVRNASRAGTKKYMRPNGQHLYDGKMHWSDRNKLVRYYHGYFKAWLAKENIEPFPIFLNYSLAMTVTFYEVMDKFTTDITNQWLIVKILENVFKEMGILKDDSPEFRKSTKFKYRFVEDTEDRKLNVKFKYVRNYEKKRKASRA